MSLVPLTAGVQLCPNLGGEETGSPSHCCLSPSLSPPPSARELELEDRQSRLQQELRERMAVEGKRDEGRPPRKGWVWACGLPPRRPDAAATAAAQTT